MAEAMVAMRTKLQPMLCFRKEIGRGNAGSVWSVDVLPGSRDHHHQGDQDDDKGQHVQDPVRVKATDGAVVAVVAVKLFEDKHKAYRELLVMADLMAGLAEEASGAGKHVAKLLFCKLVRHRDQLGIVLQLCTNGDMFDQVSFGVLPLEVCSFYFKQLSTAVMYLEGRRVCHRDIKLENMLLDSTWTLQLCDFGVAATWPASIKSPCCPDLAGSEPYCAPEVLAVGTVAEHDVFEASQAGGLNTYDPRKSDVWSCAVVLFEMMFGHPLLGSGRASKGNVYFDSLEACDFEGFWQHHSNSVAFFTPPSHGFMPPGTSLSYCLKQTQGVVKQGLQVNPQRRVTTAEMVKQLEMICLMPSATHVAAFMQGHASSASSSSAS